jgi:hypothetical protein
MTPTRGRYEHRRYTRLQMATRDCRLTIVRREDNTKAVREICTLVDLSYAGLRFRGHWPLAVGEGVEFLVHLESPVYRSGFAKARIRWIRPLGFQEFDAGAEFLEESKGLFLGPDENYNHRPGWNRSD